MSRSQVGGGCSGWPLWNYVVENGHLDCTKAQRSPPNSDKLACPLAIFVCAGLEAEQIRAMNDLNFNRDRAHSDGKQ